MNSNYIVAERFAVGDGATICYYSDRHAYTVVKITPKTMTLQRDEAVLLNHMNSGQPDALQCVAGGFAGHVSGEQRWSYKQNNNAKTVVARLTKRGWKVDGSMVIFGRHEYYDYNF